MMTKVWMYTVAQSKDPDNIRCVVPWRVDESLVFFGPCKKRIRERLRGRFLGADRNHAAMTEDLFIVGVNGANPERVRKVAWWGRLSEVMTFAEAAGCLRGERFRKLRDHPVSPLHVRPLVESGRLIGYQHVSKEHIRCGEWVSDLVSNSERQNVHVDGRRLMLRHGSAWETFDRDCCMLLENRFFALGQGIEFDEEALDILRDAQPGRPGIDSYAVFGLTANGQANGLRGTFLELAGELAERFVAWLEDRPTEGAAHRRDGCYGPTKTRCT